MSEFDSEIEKSDRLKQRLQASIRKETERMEEEYR